MSSLDRSANLQRRRRSPPTQRRRPEHAIAVSCVLVGDDSRVRHGSDCPAASRSRGRSLHASPAGLSPFAPYRGTPTRVASGDSKMNLPLRGIPVGEVDDGLRPPQHVRHLAGFVAWRRHRREGQRRSSVRDHRSTPSAPCTPTPVATPPNSCREAHAPSSFPPCRSPAMLCRPLPRTVHAIRRSATEIPGGTGATRCHTINVRGAMRIASRSGVVGRQRIGDLERALPTAVARRHVAVGRPCTGPHMPLVCSGQDRRPPPDARRSARRSGLSGRSRRRRA